MLIVCISWLLLFCGAAGTGWAALSRLGANRIEGADPEDNLTIAVWTGLGVIAACSLISGLFGAVTPWFALLFLWPVFFSAACRRWLFESVSGIPQQLGFSMVVVALAVALHGAITPVDAYDTGLYHQQAISWLSHYGVVPGLAWLNERFGWNSGWFAVSALFNHGELAGRVSPITGGFLIVISIFHWLLKTVRVFRGTASRGAWLLFLVYPALIGAASVWHYDIALGADFGTWVLTLLCVWAALLLANGREDTAACLPLLLGAIGCEFKFSRLPVLPAAIVFILLRRGRRMPWLAAFLCMLPVLAPITANLRGSGCPLFPSKLFCINTVGSITPTYAASIEEGTRNYNRSSGIAANGKGNEWIRRWYREKDRSSLLGLAVLGGILIIVRLRRDWGNEPIWFFPWLMGTLAVCVGFVFWGAPNPRFMMADLLVLPALAVAGYICNGESTNRRISFAGAAAMLALVIAVSEVAWDAHRKSFDSMLASHLLIPGKIAQSDGDSVHVYNRSIDRWVEFRTKRIVAKDFVYRVPTSGDQCWNAELPCAANLVTAPIRLNSEANGLAGGFSGR